MRPSALAVLRLITSSRQRGACAIRNRVRPGILANALTANLLDDDDAEIGKLGSCEIESWSSFAAAASRPAQPANPACAMSELLK